MFGQRDCGSVFINNAKSSHFILKIRTKYFSFWLFLGLFKIKTNRNAFIYLSESVREHFLILKWDGNSERRGSFMLAF